MIGATSKNEHGQSALTSYTATTLTFEGIAYIPLSQMNDFFAKIPSTSASSGFELRIQTNLASSNTYIVNYASPLTGATAKTAGITNVFTVTGLSAVQSIGHTCPFMISQAGCGAGTGLSLFPGATGDTIITSSVTMTAKIGNSSLMPCRLVIPVISFTPEYTASILSNPTSRILYNDYYVDTIQNVPSQSNVTRVLSSQVSRARRLFIIPYLSTTAPTGSGGGNLISPIGSPLSSAPNTSSMCRLSNFQIQIGGTNILSEQMKYNYDFYNSNVMQLVSKMNGNSTKSLFFSGMITKSMWEKCYGTYVFSLEKCTDEITDNQKKNITVSFRCDTNSTLFYDFIIITEFQMETYLNRALGKITATA
jgi:hypothetical protein